MASLHSYFSLAGFLITSSLTGCGLINDEPRACTDLAAASVNVILKDSKGAPVSGARVDYSVDGGTPRACDDLDDGSYVCGYEITGVFSIVAVEGRDEASGSVTVTRGECHVNPQVLTLTLMPGSF